MSVVSDEAWSPVGARVGKVEAIPITATSTVFDLSARTNIYADLQAGRLCLADADGADVYYFFSSENSGTADPANVTAANATQCARIPTGALVEFRPPYYSQAEINAPSSGLTNIGMARYLVARTATGSTATLRLHIASEAPSKKYGG